MCSKPGGRRVPGRGLCGDFSCSVPRWVLASVCRLPAAWLAPVQQPRSHGLSHLPSSLPPASRPEDAHIRVKRYRTNSYAHLNPSGHIGCRFGTCTMHKLAHQIYRLTDKDKDGSAPANKISPQGYGRRRRSLRESPVAAALGGGSRTILSRLLASRRSP